MLFLPDQFLGAHVRRVTGRENLHVWAGECHVHAGISPQALRDAAAANPEAELFVHPECGCSTSALWQAGTGDLPAERTRVLSTGGMLAAARSTRAPAVLVATETGMLHQLRKANPDVRWEPVNPARELPLHEDDHGRGAGALPARRDDRGERRPGDRGPCPHRGRGHDRDRPGAGDCERPMTGPTRATGATGATTRIVDRCVHGDVHNGPSSAQADASTARAGEVGADAAAVNRVIRALPPARARWRRDADVVVVGSGAAGISAALTAAAAGLRVLVVTKDLIGGATPLAQGGLAAAIGPGDSAASHVSDTLTAGAGLCEPDVVAALADAAPGAIDWLAALGARLDTRELRLEGGHSHHRIVHSGDDASGAEVHRALLAALLASGIEILDRTVALDLIVENPAGGRAGRRGGCHRRSG